MNKYSFLLKPLFFIFSLVFATWLTLFIERLQPSDFGKYEYIFSSEPKPVTKAPVIHTEVEHTKKSLGSSNFQKESIKKLCADYKSGVIDSIILDKKIEILLNSTERVSEK